MRNKLTDRLTKAVFPARIRTSINIIIRYAFWNGIIDWSANDMPAFVYAETTWKSENLLIRIQLLSWKPISINSPGRVKRNRCLKYGLPSIRRDIRCYSNECYQLNTDVVLHKSANCKQWMKGWFTPATIQRRAFRARYSTPPISSSWSLVRKWKVEFGPTRVSNERYGAYLDPGLFSWSGANDVVTGIVTVLLNFFLSFGKSLAKREPMIVHGIGNPPRSRFILSRWRWMMEWAPCRPLPRVRTDGECRLRFSSLTWWSLIVVGSVMCSWFLSEGANSTVGTRGKDLKFFTGEASASAVNSCVRTAMILEWH